MNLERLTEQYLKDKAHADTLQKRINQFKELLAKQVDSDGIPDDKGHKYLQAGRFQLQRQLRQGDPYLDREAAEEYARQTGIWDDVKVVREALDEDALAGWLFENKDKVNPETGVKYEDEYRGLFKTPDPSWAFMAPKENPYDEY